MPEKEEKLFVVDWSFLTIADDCWSNGRSRFQRRNTCKPDIVLRLTITVCAVWTPRTRGKTKFSSYCDGSLTIADDFFYTFISQARENPFGVLQRSWWPLVSAKVQC